MAPIATALADNATFAKTLADKLTDTSANYRSALRGDKGETGNLSTSKDAVKSALYDTKYTLWCADGDICKVPADNKGINIAGSMSIDGATINNTGRMHISGEELLYLLNKNGVVVGREWGGNGNLSVQGNLDVKGEIHAPNGVNLVHGGSKISDINGNLYLDTDDWVVFPSKKIKLGEWQIDASDGNIRFRKDGHGNGEMFVIHNREWHNGSTWVHGNYYSNTHSKWL